MTRIISAVYFLFLLFFPVLLHSQNKSFVSLNVQPSANGSILIQWNIPRDSDTLPFEIERSMDQKIWNIIAHVNTRLSHRYSYIDTLPGEGLLYYRIRQISNDEQILYTQVKWVQANRICDLYIWPNPSNNILHVKTPYSKGSIDIISSDGKLIGKMAINNYVTDISTANLSAGTYFLQIMCDGDVLIERFLKE